MRRLGQGRATILACVLVLAGLSAPNVYGQHFGLAFEHLTTRDGLPGSTVFDILQDRSGFLWLATGNGLARFDGYTLDVFRPLSDSAGSTALVRTLYEDHDGTFWVGMHDGLYSFDPLVRELSRYPLTDSMASIGAIAEDPSHLLWIGTSRGLYVVDH